MAGGCTSSSRRREADSPPNQRSILLSALDRNADDAADTSS
jgi:hypothetical protein